MTPLTAPADELRWRNGGAVFQASQPAIRHRVDPAVQPAGIEKTGTVEREKVAENGLQFRSVIINRDEANHALRSAQRASSESNSEASETTDASNGSQIQDESQDLFGPMPEELPPFEAEQPESLDLDAPPRAEEDTIQLDMNQRQPLDRPGEFQPGVPPDAALPLEPLPETIPTPSVGTMEEEREKSAQACEQGLSDLQSKTIDTLSLSIAVTGDEGSDYPFECSLEEGRWHEGRSWEQTTYLWKASALCHKPLFFEDEHLERYGHSWTPLCQPLVSGAHFFTRLPILPYCMGVEPPNECIYALGHYRPGSCAPYMCNPVPLSWRGALFQAGAVVGAAAALP